MKHPADFHPKKSFGQNFLINPRIVERIIRTAGLKGSETVLEAGPGFGILTNELIKHAKHVIAIEKDKKLYEYLCHSRATAAAGSRPGGKSGNLDPRSESGMTKTPLTLRNADVLQVPPPKTPYVLIANIPYSITSPLMDHFIRDNPKHMPRLAVLMVQKEVAQKICSQPPHMNVLALHVQTFGTPKIIATVSKNNFWPRPKVDSAILRIDFHEKWKLIPDLDKYFEVIHRAFEHKRKMLRSEFSASTLKKAKIEPMWRPENLTIEQWKNLSVCLGPFTYV